MEVEDAITTTIFDVGVAAIAQRSSEVRVREMGFKQQRMEEETTTKVITSTTILPSRNEEKEKEKQEDLCENRGRIVYPKAARQVAGNSHKHARAARVDACGHFYKPTDDTRKGMTELQFYENWQAMEHERVPEFSPFLATFVSRTVLYESRDAAKPMPFLKLRDVTADMKQANVVDIKIGERTWHPSHDAAYREKTASRRLGNDFVFDRVSRVWDANLRGRKQYGEVLE